MIKKYKKLRNIKKDVHRNNFYNKMMIIMSE